MISDPWLSGPKKWIEATVEFINADEEFRASFIAECMELGATGSSEPMEVKDAGGEDQEPRTCDACGNFSRLFVYFPADKGMENVLDLLEQRARQVSIMSPGSSARVMGCRSVEREDWAKNWMRGFPPDRITERLWVVPPWEDDPLPEGAIAIILEPGMAFGTGKHVTTRHCLELIEEVSQCGASPCGSFLDVGCGSGILAIAARKLGSTHVLGLDADPDAIHAARTNLLRNGLVEHVRLVNGPLECCRGRFELIAANLTSPVLSAYAGLVGSLLLPGGQCILSGVLFRELEKVLELFTQIGFRVVKQKTDPEDEWVSILLKH